MTTFVLVHGGGHGGWCWRPVARHLRAAGHEVYAPTLTGLGDRRHLLRADTGLETHVEDVAALLFHEDLRAVVLVGHSYGGMVVTGVADRMPERIACLTYLDAAIPLDGEALIDVSPGLQAFRDVRVVNGIALGLWPDANVAALYGIDDPDLAAWMLPRLTPQPWRSFEQPLSLNDPERLAAIPRAIVNCTGSLARRPAATLDRWLSAGYVREVDTGHDLMLTEPGTVAALLEEIAALDWQGG